MGRKTCGLLFLGLLASPLAAAPPRAGGEFRVNTYTPNQQSGAAVASDGSGRFVVAWQSTAQDGQNEGIFGQRFDAAGQPLGAEFPVNVSTANAQFSPVVAMGPAGNFVVAWVSGGGQDGDGNGIFARHFDASGNPASGEFQVNQYTTAGQFGPAIAADSAGNFVIAWTSTAPSGIRARRFDPTLVGGLEVPLAAGALNAPSLAMNADGTFAAVWSSFGQDGSDWGVFGRRFDAALAPVGAAFPVNTYTSQDQDRAMVVATGAGAFTVVWQSETQDGDEFGIVARRFDATATPLGGEFAVNTYTSAAQQTPRVAAAPGGGFLVVWESWTQEDGTFAGVFGRTFDSAGTALDPVEFRVNTYTALNQRGPAVAADPDGRFVVAWHGDPSDGSGYSVRAQRFGDLIFKDGVESGGLSAWSSGVTDGGDLTVSAEAALAGTGRGLRGVVDDVNPLYVQDDSPIDERRYRARFYLHPNGFDPGEALLHRRVRLFVAFSEAPLRRVAAVVLRRQNGIYALLGRARLDDNQQADTGFFTISDAPHAVEIDLVCASGPDTLDGTFQMWIDGVSVAQLTGLDNNLGEVDLARLGALSVKSGATGTIYWDELESRRATEIGVLP